MSRFRKLTTIAAVAALALGLAACGGGDDAVMDTDPDPTPTPYEMALTNIAAAGTAADAQDAYDAVKDEVTAAEGDLLQAAVNARSTALATAARAAMQRMNLMDAAGGIPASVDATAEAIADAKEAIGALQDAIDAADDVDTSTYVSMVTAANMLVTTAQGHVDTQTRMGEQMTALTNANTALTTALAAISGAPTQAEIDDAETALANLNTAIDDAADLDDTSMYALAVANAEGQIAAAKRTLMANMDQDELDRIEAERLAAEAMAATAAKLYAGISAPVGDGTGNDDRFAAYNALDTAILVHIGDGTNPDTGTTLTEDKDATVADNHGWEGKRYTDLPGGDSYEAIVYSNVEEPEMGDKFGINGGGTGYQYTLAMGMLAIDTSSTAEHVSRIGGTSFDHSAGIKRFALPQPNTIGQTHVSLVGSFHGVPGTYRCTPGAAVCAANVDEDGFRLGTVPSATDAMFTDGAGAWMFTPSDANARVMESADTVYASYGWWLRKAANDGPFSASAFVDYVGGDGATGVPAAADLDNLDGSATYMGGAAGKYALASSTGGTNDAGHFTARATLEANFTTNTAVTALTGTIDQFIGADGETRDWTVELESSAITNVGEIGSRTAMEGTTWTIGDAAADESGSWTGSLRNNGADGVPQVATGTFYTEYGTAGNMVGAFGANKQ